MASKRFLLYFLVLSFRETSGKPLADTKAQSHQKERVLSNSQQSSRYLKDKKDSSQLERNVWFKDDENDEEDTEMNEYGEMNEEFEQNDEVMGRSKGEESVHQSIPLSKIRRGSSTKRTANTKGALISTQTQISASASVPRSHEEGDERQSTELELWDDSASQGNF